MDGFWLQLLKQNDSMEFWNFLEPNYCFKHFSFQRKSRIPEFLRISLIPTNILYRSWYARHVAHHFIDLVTAIQRAREISSSLLMGLVSLMSVLFTRTLSIEKSLHFRLILTYNMANIYRKSLSLSQSQWQYAWC